MQRNGSLVIVGCGYVGSALAHVARDAGWRVTGVVRSASSRAALAQAGVDAVCADVAAGEVQALPARADAVVYAVSAGGRGAAGAADGASAYRAAYDRGVRHALAWAQAAGARAFVLTSSTGVYGATRDADESSQVGGTPHADALVAGEQAVLQSDVATRIVLRLGGLYGPARHYLSAQIRAGTTHFAGACTQRINYLHRDDAVSALLAALSAPAGACCLNVTDGSPVVKADLIRWLCARQGTEPVFLDDGAPQAPVPDRIVHAQRIRDLLGWQPRFPDVYAGLSHDEPARTARLTP